MPGLKPYNLGYIKTKPGIFKCISLVIGLLAFAFTVSAFDAATYYNFNYQEYLKDAEKNSGKDSTQKSSGRELKMSDNELYKAHLNAPRNEGKEELVTNNYDNCDFQRKTWDYWVKTAEKYGSTAEDVQKYFGFMEQPKPCPSKYFVILPMVIIIITWMLGFIMLIALLGVDLNQKIESFVKVDFIGHLTATVLLALSTLALGGFILWVFLSNYPCSKEMFERGYKGDYFVFLIGPDSDATSNSRISKYDPNKKFKTCLELKDDVYKIWTLIIATVFTGVTTVLFGVTMMVLHKFGGGGRGYSSGERSTSGEGEIVNELQPSTTPTVSAEFSHNPQEPTTVSSFLNSEQQSPQLQEQET